MPFDRRRLLAACEIVAMFSLEEVANTAEIALGDARRQVRAEFGPRVGKQLLVNECNWCGGSLDVEQNRTST